MPAESRIAKYVAQLQDDDFKTRSRAMEFIDHFSRHMQAHECIELLQTAEELIERQNGKEPVNASKLVKCATFNSWPQCVPVVAKLYGRLDDESRCKALGMFSALEEESAAKAYLKLVVKYGWPREINSRTIFALADPPRHTDLLFPALLDLAQGTHVECEVLRTALTFGRAGLITGDLLKPHSSWILRLWGEKKAETVTIRARLGERYHWHEDYEPVRIDAGLLLDVMGFIPGDDVGVELEAALTDDDAHLQTFAATSQLRRGNVVPRAVIRRILDDRASCLEFIEMLDMMKMLDAVSDFRLTVEDMAIATMVNWLMFPTELARAPDEIELMHTYRRLGDDGEFDYCYLLRFRCFKPHWSAEDGWMTGVSGPFRDVGLLSHRGACDTFSCFEPWDEHSPDEHVQVIMGETGREFERID